MKQSFFPETGTWLKGNIHAHTTRTDGICAPKQQILDYYEKGYDFLAITDHNVIDSHQLGDGLDICMIPGWERDIRHCPDNTKCIHLLGLLASNADEVSEREERRYDCQEISDQQLIDEMRGEGQFVVLAHPVWSRMTPDEVLALERFQAIEVFNTGCEVLMHAGRADLYWDLLLQNGRKVWGIACDDTHGDGPKSDRFGGWIMVRSEQKTAAAILKEIQMGTFYLSQGPTIEDWGRDGDKIYFRCSPCKTVHVTAYPSRGKSFYAEEGEYLTEISFELHENTQYIRIECVDENGCTAWTNPYFF